MGVFTSEKMSAEKPGLRALVSAAMLGGIITVWFQVIEKSPERERRASPGVCESERLACFERDSPRRRGGFSVITFVPRYLHAGNWVGVFKPTTRSRPRLG